LVLPCRVTACFCPTNVDAIGIFDTTSGTFRVQSVSDGRLGSMGIAVLDGALYLAPSQHRLGILGDIVSVEWTEQDEQILAKFKDRFPGRTSPRLVERRICTHYDCFGTGKPDCKPERLCLKPTVNVKLVTRLSWFSAFLAAASQTAYYEILATAILVGVYLIYLRCCVSKEPAVTCGAYAHVVLESDSATELKHLRWGDSSGISNHG